MAKEGRKWSIGSTWIRIDPHIHAPGTVLNNQFGDDWAGYVQRINSAVPKTSVLGITDYFGLAVYEKVRERWLRGEMPGVSLLFPNIEIRLNLKVDRGSGVNLHLLVDPTDDDHVERVREKLQALTFVYDSAGRETYRCSDQGLQRLGRAFSKGSGLTDAVALRVGVEQFKVNLDELNDIIARDAWFRKNVLLAVPTGADGGGGFGRNDAFEAVRETLLKRADIILSGNPADREFWSGRNPSFGSLRVDPKPCLHGSDAHSLDAVLAPAKDRRCWIRCEPTFEGLRQTILEPERRVYVGDATPPRPVPAQTIRSVRAVNANSWFPDQPIRFNEGLVTIIGARGSGKTALADLVAFAACALSVKPGPASFVTKAQSDRLLNGVMVEITWGDGAKSSATFGAAPPQNGEPLVRYLSQQFVEELCSKEGLAGPLVAEIERVVFNAIPEEDRQGADSFTELRDIHVEPMKIARASAESAVAELTATIAVEHKLQSGLPSLRTDVKESRRQLDAANREIGKLPAGNDPAKKLALDAVDSALKALKAEVARLDRRSTDLNALRAEVADFYRQARQKQLVWQQRFGGILSPADWEGLVPVGSGPLDRLKLLQVQAALCAANARNHGVTDGAGAPGRGVAALTEETGRLTRELGLDPTTVTKRTELSRKAAELTQLERRQLEQIAHAERAAVRIQAAKEARLDAYVDVFENLASEARSLDALYGPLQARAKSQAGSKVEFMVKRIVDVAAWAKRGESLLDLRRTPFAGKNGLADLAEHILGEAWRTGSPSDVRAAMAAFLSDQNAPSPNHLLQEAQPEALGQWLFSTEHVRVVYGVLYERTELHRLSPGTRGVVLLTLYLGLDEWDRRPLIIDQPEENLDPQSVYAELVGFFRAASARRQVIMVTHNANLVVNTDSDQVIVATGERTSTKTLPRITYVAGGLEDLDIRASVCGILEGGKAAFQKRGRRYGVAQ